MKTNFFSLCQFRAKETKKKQKSLFNVFLKIYIKHFTSSKYFVVVYRPTLKQRGL